MVENSAVNQLVQKGITNSFSGYTRTKFNKIEVNKN